MDSKYTSNNKSTMHECGIRSLNNAKIRKPKHIEEIVELYTCTLICVTIYGVQNCGESDQS
jgi:hypothetical protein